MLIEYFGHSMLRLTLAHGATLVTDPYWELYDYPKRRLSADFCTISHHHYDHDGIQALCGTSLAMDTEGVFTPKPGLTITGIPTFHDEAAGAKRGNNLVFLIEGDGLRIVHLGDLGHILTPKQVEAIGVPDVLFVPVGGHYTIDAATALQVIAQLQPRVALPIHYHTQASGGLDIAPLASFLALLPTAPPPPMPMVRLTLQDISQRPPILVMATPEGL